MNLSRQVTWKIILIGIMLVAAIAVTLIAGNPTIEQPIAFNHKKHIDNNVPCNFCHRYYETTRAAGIPSVQVCITCHEDVMYVTPEKAKIQHYYRERKSIPWKQIYQVPDYVFFSHRLHVVAGKVECSQCHGPVTTREQPFTRQPIPVKMKRCIECHKNNRVIANPYECIRCHY